jgi:hypothetical protein
VRVCVCVCVYGKGAVHQYKGVRGRRLWAAGVAVPGCGVPGCGVRARRHLCGAVQKVLMAPRVCERDGLVHGRVRLVVVGAGEAGRQADR